MKITIEIEETHPRYSMVQEALTRPILGEAPEITYSKALSQARAWYGVFNEIKNERKIEAIKNVRAFTGLGLKDAKDLVEAL
jgi:ribosomal protein L7/L12